MKEGRKEGRKERKKKKNPAAHIITTVLSLHLCGSFKAKNFPILRQQQWNNP
jgi:hypothetical protein